MNRNHHEAIRAIIDRQFGSLNWTCSTPASWSDFLGDFLPGASLYAAARPVVAQTPEASVERMKGSARDKLRSFKEIALGHEIFVFGNVAVAIAACEMTENETNVTRGIEMMLLVNTEDRWRIAAQAWDKEFKSRRLPRTLIAQR